MAYSNSLLWLNFVCTLQEDFGTLGVKEMTGVGMVGHRMHQKLAPGIFSFLKNWPFICISMTICVSRLELATWFFRSLYNSIRICHIHEGLRLSMEMIFSPA